MSEHQEPLPLSSPPRPLRWVRLGLAAAAVIGLAWWYVEREQPPSRPLPAGQLAPAGAEDGQALAPIAVQVIQPTRRDVTYTLTLPANVAPLYQTTLYAKVSGYLKWIGPDKGDRVTRGQVLAVIDAPEIEEQYEQALSDFKIKKLTFERLHNVWKDTPDVIAKQDVDVAEAAYDGAKNLVEQRATMRDYMKVRAPYDGVITARFVDPGALIQVATASATGAIPLFTLMDLNTVRVYVNVPQEEVAYIEPGKTKASLRVEELPERTFTGTVTRTTLALDPATRTMLAEIDLPNPDRALQPGTFGQVTLQLRTIQKALVIPPGAIVASGKRKTVFVAKDGKAISVPIHAGISDGRWVEIVEGLAEEDAVVIVGKGKLTDGVPVAPAPYDLPEGTPASQRFERRTPGGNGNGASRPPASSPIRKEAQP